MKHVVAAAFVLVAAVGTPNLITARQRSAQKRTMADIRSIATAWEARATDVNSYSVGGGAVSYEALSHALVPKYIRTLPRRDGWGRPFDFAATDQQYTIRSRGRDDRVDASDANQATTSFDNDIVYSNGTFTRYPEGT